VPSDEAIAELLAERMTSNGVGMVVGVIDGERRSVITHGISGAEDGRPLDGATVFQIGSLTKVVTTLLLADMVSRGEVALDDPVVELLPPQARMRTVSRPATLRDLATHTSGLPSMPTDFDLRGQPDPYAAYSVEQLWAFLSEYQPEWAPGTEYRYSNLGVSLLGRALALRMGTTYETLVERRVLEPLGMTSTSITVTPDQLRRLAPGHDPYLQPVGTWEMSTLQASGSLRSTADDMLLLLAAYLGTGSAPELEQAVAIQLAEGVDVDGGFRPLGVGRRADGTYRHAGGKEGYRSGLAFDPSRGVGAVVLANTRTYEDEPMDIALHLVTGEPLPSPSVAPASKPRVFLATERLESLVGTYRSSAGREWEVIVAGEVLRIRYPNNSILDFVASGATDFFYGAGNDDIAFTLDAEGRATRMTIYGDGKAAGSGEVADRSNAPPG
jgi:CubicO group peptidase (beta-lactamase class C family)